MNQSSCSLRFHRIQFSINKWVHYGQAVYVCGNIPELGDWSPERAFRLKCIQNDHWNGILLLTKNIPCYLEFKYLVADWDHPSSFFCCWESGSHNRKLGFRKSVKTTICEDRWNMDKIILKLHVSKRNSSLEEERYYVVGNLEELGANKQPKIMKKVHSRTLISKKENLVQLNLQNKEEIYTFSYFSEKNKDQFNYFYIRKTQNMQRERKPGRIFKFDAQTSPHPQRKSVTYSKGEISINDECSLNAIKFSQITPKIYVGSYPKSLSDIQRLKMEGIKVIFSIQTEKDFKNHGFSLHYFRLMCQESGVKFIKYAIQDMSSEDFINKAEGGVKLMKELIKEEKVYVHCSAGIYRSPQMIALYLILYEQYSAEKAVQTIKEKHPYAQPNIKIIKQALGLIHIKNAKLASFH